MVEMNYSERKDRQLNLSHVPQYQPPSLHIVTSSRNSSCSVRSATESLNDFLDLYADDSSSTDAFSVTHSISDLINQESTIPNSNKHVIGSIEKESSTDEIAIQRDRQPTQSLGENVSLIEQPHKMIYSSGFKNEEPTAAAATACQPNTTIISDVDHTIVGNSMNENTLDNTMLSDPKSQRYTYNFDDEELNEGLSIDESILDMINSLGSELDPEQELEIELSPEILDQLHKTNLMRYKSTSNSTLNSIDLLSIEIPSEDADYDDPNRFKTFFGIDSGTSSSEYEESCEIIEEEEEQEEGEEEYHEREDDEIEFQDEGISESGRGEDAEENYDGIDVSVDTPLEFLNIGDQASEYIQSLDISPVPESNENLQGTSLSLDMSMPDKPPPYCEVDEIHIKRLQEQQDEEMAVRLQREEYEHANTPFDDLMLEAQDHVSDIRLSPAKPNSSVSLSFNNSRSLNASSIAPSNSAHNSPLKRKISIKLKKNKDGELSRHASVDYYQMDRYLPPYRSLINPNKAFDYRTNSYIDANDNDIEIKSGEDNKPMVAIHKKKRDSKLMSILLTTNNNIKQKLIDVANDTQSIKSRSRSVRSLSSITHSIHSEPKSKPTALFNDLPGEMHQLIVNQIDNQHDLVNCLYVSRSFQSYAIPNLYRYPKFTSSYRLGQFVHTILNYPTYATFVKVLDLSKITFPVFLTESEKVKYQDKLVYGSSTAMELLNEKKRVVHAGWRDWKYRNHPLYGDFNKWRKRANSVSTTASTGSGGISWDLATSKNLSAPNLLDPKKFTSSMTTNTMVSTNTRVRSHSGSENTMKRLSNKSRSRSNSASNNSRLNSLGSTGTRNSYTGGTSSGNSSANASNSSRSSKQGDNGSFVKSFKKAFGLDPAAPGKKRRGISPVRKPLVKASSSGTIPTWQKKKVHGKHENTHLSSKSKASSSKRKSAESGDGGCNGETRPFGTPHQKMNILLKQYCFNRDVPVGYIIHILDECANLEELNLSNVVVSTDYELRDYASFDWYSGSGEMIGKSRVPVVLDPGRPVFWSDSGRDMDLTDTTFIQNYAESMEVKALWKHIYRMRKLKRLLLRRINSLEMSIIEGFVMRSEFRESLQYLDCSKSGMVKRSEWDELKSAQEWRQYFRSKPL